MGEIAKSKRAEHSQSIEYNGIRQKSFTKKKTGSLGNRVGIHQNSRTGQQPSAPSTAR
jgi:hypothetical protein